MRYQSDQIKYYNLIEQILFNKLKEYRLSSNREFFDCDLGIIKSSLSSILDEINNGGIVDIILNNGIKINNISDLYSQLINLINVNRQELSNLLDFEGFNTSIDKIPIKNKVDIVCDAKEISDIEYTRISSLPLDQLYTDQLASLEKYCIKKEYSNVNIDSDFIRNKYDTFNRKLNADLLVGKRHILRETEQWEQKKRLITDVINKLGFNVYDTQICLNSELFQNNISKVIKGSELLMTSRGVENYLNMIGKRKLLTLKRKSNLWVS